MYCILYKVLRQFIRHVQCTDTPAVLRHVRCTGHSSSSSDNEIAQGTLADHQTCTMYSGFRLFITYVLCTGHSGRSSNMYASQALRQIIKHAQCTGHYDSSSHVHNVQGMFTHIYIIQTGHSGSSQTYIRTGHSGSSHTYTVHTQGTPAVQTTYTLYRASDTHTHVHCTGTPVVHTHAQCTGRSGSSHTCTLGCTFSIFYTSWGGPLSLSV
jgi:hypothetical protein